jgi:hypothetical protein
MSLIPIYSTLSDIEPRSVEWLWRDRIAAGRITLIAGDPGIGKSWATLDIMARLSCGKDWPDGTYNPPGSVLLMNCEDNASDTLRPRLDLLGANVSKIHLLEAVDYGDDTISPITLDHYEVIRTAIMSVNARLLVIDPITGFFGAGADANRDTYIRHTFRPLAQIAEETGCAIVMVAHLNKSSEQSIQYRFSGSVQYTGAARMAYLIGRDRSDAGRRLMVCVKNNIGADRWALAYRVDPEHETEPVRWESEPILSDDLEEMVSNQRESEDLKEITEWLMKKVNNDRGVSVGMILKEAKQAGWSQPHVMRARHLCGIRLEQIGGEWYWLPRYADPTKGRGWTDEA